MGTSRKIKKAQRRGQQLFMVVNAELKQMAVDVLKAFDHLAKDAKRRPIELTLQVQFDTPASAIHSAEIITELRPDKKTVVAEGAEVKCDVPVYLAADEKFVALATVVAKTEVGQYVRVERPVKQAAKQYLDAFKPGTVRKVVATKTTTNKATHDFLADELGKSLEMVHHLQFGFLRQVALRCQPDMPRDLKVQCEKVCEVTIKAVEDGLEISSQGFSSVDLTDAKRKDIYALALLGTDCISLQDFALARFPDLGNSKTSYNAAETFNKMAGRLKQFVPEIKVVKLRDKKRRLAGIKIVKDMGVTDDMLHEELGA